MNVLEKILEEINKRVDFRERLVKYERRRGTITDVCTNKGALEELDIIAKIIRSHMDEAEDINVPSKDGWIDRKNLKEEIESLRFAITGMRNGKTVTNLALEEYRKSILGIIDEQPTYMDGGWIPVEERLPEEGQKVLVWYEYFRYGEYNCMFETYGIGWQFDGHWNGDVSGIKARCIAWLPLPEPYRRSKKEKSSCKEHIMSRFMKVE